MPIPSRPIALPANPVVRSTYARYVHEIREAAMAVPKGRMLTSEHVTALYRWALLCESICPQVDRTNMKPAHDLHVALGVDLLQGPGIEPLFRTYNMPHGFNADQIELIGDWLQYSREPVQEMVDFGVEACIPLRLSAGHEHSLWLTVAKLNCIPVEKGVHQWGFRGMTSGFLWRDIEFFITDWMPNGRMTAASKAHERLKRALDRRLTNEAGLRCHWVPCPQTLTVIEKALEARRALTTAIRPRRALHKRP